MTQSDPRLAEYRKWEGVDPWEEQSGPYYFQKEENGHYRCATITGRHSMNSEGRMHGGALMTFADYSLFVFARDCLQGITAVTVSITVDFIGGGGEGQFLESTGEVVHETGTLIFARGKIFHDEQVLLAFSGVLKKMNPRVPTYT
ncbi:acyl-CoA thioesterase [Geobacter metallireducens GS-15]|uniref:Acyl-CoA thioesterase n=1 Tax=Geobacter metallireducens (strain ATCC 53774 / DSM 7210 / GS-15) TaxID=269799 RepID=Q39TG3_GEOMG|nr:PaaI family thioesterase [Geobacter metallireducens]ABB32461.1 acyl-CoA thioesterase [Geobacter metallireducens GS-15]